MEAPFVHNCPKCGRRLIAGGELPIRGKPARLFSCSSCTIPMSGAARVVRTRYIYAVDEAGEVWDAARIVDQG
jgi:hypothetical protein